MIYNDDTIIPGFVDIGIPSMTRVITANDGCWETLVAGKSHFSYAHVMNLCYLEWVPYQGRIAQQQRA